MAIRLGLWAVIVVILAGSLGKAWAQTPVCVNPRWANELYLNLTTISEAEYYFVVNGEEYVAREVAPGELQTVGRVMRTTKGTVRGLNFNAEERTALTARDDGAAARVQPRPVPGIRVVGAGAGAPNPPAQTRLLNKIQRARRENPFPSILELAGNAFRGLEKRFHVVFFGTGEAQLMGNHFRMLDQMLDRIKGTRHQQVIVVGVAEPEGDALENYKNAVRRAQSVSNYFLGRGVSRQKLCEIALGPEDLKSRYRLRRDHSRYQAAHVIIF